MPAGPDETHHHKANEIHDSIAANPSSKTESTASTHPMHKGEEVKGEQVQFMHHEANLGPAVPKDLKAQEEGTKEERLAKAKEMNQ